MDIQAHFRSLLGTVLDAWTVERVLMASEAGPVPAGARLNQALRINLVLRGRQRLCWGDRGRPRWHELGPSEAFLGLPGAWDKSERKRQDLLTLGLLVPDYYLRLVSKDFRAHSRRRPLGPDHEWASASVLPPAARHLVGALRDCGPRPADDPALRGMVHALCQFAYEHLRRDEGAAVGAAEARWRRIRLLLQERCHEDLSRGEVARIVGIDPATVSVLARRFEDKRFVDVLNELRLARARELLRRGGLTITEVAQRSGFSSSTYFGRCFKRRYRMTASQWCVRAGVVNATGPSLG